MTRVESIENTRVILRCHGAFIQPNTKFIGLIQLNHNLKQSVELFFKSFLLILTDNLFDSLTSVYLSSKLNARMAMSP